MIVLEGGLDAPLFMSFPQVILFFPISLIRSNAMKQCVLFLCLMMAISASAQMPKTLNYQGTLTSGSTVVPDGNYNVTFRLYTAPSGGSAVWTEAQTVVTRNGVFNAVLGKFVPLPASFNTSYWMSLKIGADPEASPRLEMTGVCYSMHSAVADSARKVANGSVTLASIADNAVTSAKILDEPGVSSSLGGVHFLNAGNKYYVLDSLDIALPASGMVVLIASGSMTLGHVEGEAMSVNISISDTRNTLSAGYSCAALPATAATGLHAFPFCTSGIYAATGGSKKYFLLAQYLEGTQAMTFVGQTRLTGMYFPTVMGTTNMPGEGLPFLKE